MWTILIISVEQIFQEISGRTLDFLIELGSISDGISGWFLGRNLLIFKKIHGGLSGGFFRKKSWWSSNENSERKSRPKEISEAFVKAIEYRKEPREGSKSKKSEINFWGDPKETVGKNSEEI